MKYTINESVCSQKGLSLSEVLYLMLVKTGSSFESIKNSLLNKEALLEVEQESIITPRWDDILATILLDSEKENPQKEEQYLTELANKMMACFPKGKKEGTNIYWRGNSRDILLRLKKFFKLYGNKYSKEQILDATTKYVSSFNGDYRFMRALKYFIWKDEKKYNVEGKMFIEEVSDLASFIENEDEEQYNQDWTTSLV